MNDRTDTTAPDSPPADPCWQFFSTGHRHDHERGRRAPSRSQTCTLAGRTDLIAGFLEAQTSPTKVRSQLLAAQADASPEIVSRIDPQAPTTAANAGHPASPHNPLVQAVKTRLGQQ